MASLTDRENDELLSYLTYLTACDPLLIEPLETPINELNAPTANEPYPLETAEEAMTLNNMFASFLCSGTRGHTIAVSGGFGADGRYHIVGAGNSGREGVRRPSDQPCAELAQACTKFISGNTRPHNPNDVFAILVAALDICHSHMARRLTTITTGANFVALSTSNMGLLDNWALHLHSKFCLEAAVLEGVLERWTRKSPENTRVAARYWQLLQITFELWERIENFEPIRSKRQMEDIYEFNNLFNIAKGLLLLRRFPNSTRVVFDWPQGPIDNDHFWCQRDNAKMSLWRTVIEDLIKSATGEHKLQTKMRETWKTAIGEAQWKKAIHHTRCRIHCEIYMALHILFSESDVRFHSFLVEGGKRVFTIGCSRASCLACWDVLLELSRQDSDNHPILMCRTRYSLGKCYATWGLTPYREALPLSLLRAVTGPKQTHMIDSLNSAVKRSHEKFKERVESSILM